MALGTPTSPTPIVGGNVSSVTSAAFTPTANALLFATLTTRQDATLAESTISDNVGLSWTSLISYSYDAGSGTRLRNRVYVAPTGAAPTSMQVTHEHGVTRRMMLALVQVTGTISVPTNVAGNHATNGSPSVTLSSAPLASSLLLGFYATPESPMAVSAVAYSVQPLLAGSRWGLGRSRIHN